MSVPAPVSACLSVSDCACLQGSLLPTNYNMWLGNTLPSEGGSSSGLHHDFHDNVYVLLRGRKRFRLFSPDHATALHTVGTISQVHPNGRICYEGAPANADGSDPDAVAAMRAELQRESAERELKAAEAAVAAGEKDASERLRAAENALEAAIEAGLDAELGIGNGTDDEDGSGADARAWGADWDGEEDESEDESEEEGQESDDTEHEKSHAGEESTEQPEDTPNNFSAIDLCEEDWRDKWPLAKNAVMTEVNIEAGEMLWLPAGWFHEVTSMTAAGAAVDGGVQDTEQIGHLAFNYWFHPPDSDAFEHPYRSNFWRWDWDQRQSLSSPRGEQSDVVNPPPK